ncbi:hypothetical protein AB0M34_02100 [Nocardia sp. NPDC050193]
MTPRPDTLALFGRVQPVVAATSLFAAGWAAAVPMRADPVLVDCS